jgi:hypothetical protein
MRPPRDLDRHGIVVFVIDPYKALKRLFYECPCDLVVKRPDEIGKCRAK